MNHLIDDNILAALLKKDSEEAWQTAFIHCRAPFVRHFEHQHNLSIEKAQPLYQEIFALMVQGLREGLIKTPLKQTIFAHLIRFGEKRLKKTGDPGTSTAYPRRPHLAGEVLILLIRNGHEDAFCTIVRQYSAPICMILKSTYPFIKETPMEVMGEALMAMKDNIENGGLKPPLRAKLFTYTCHIARNMFLAFYKKMQKGAPHNSEKEWERLIEQAAQEEEEEGYLDFVSEMWPALSLLLEDPNTAFENLISGLCDISRQILWLRFEEGLKFKAIGERLGLSDVAVRRRFLDIRIQWKKSFFLDYVLKDAKGVTRECLILYLIKGLACCKIARHYKKPESEIAEIITNYLQDWWNTNGRGLI